MNREKKHAEPRTKGGLSLPAKLVAHFPPDVVHLDVTLERQAHREDYALSLRLGLMGTVLVARDRGPTAEAALRGATNTLEQEIARYKARLRREGQMKHQRAGLVREEEVPSEDEMLEERGLADRALADDRETTS